MALATIIYALAAASFGPNNDARDVIQASLLSFFEPRDWHSADWKPQKHVVLRPEFIKNPSATYGEKFNSFNDVLKQVEAYELGNQKYFETEKPKGNDEDSRRSFLASKRKCSIRVETLRYVRSKVGKNPKRSTFLHPELAQMQFDQRIVVTDKSNRFLTSSEDQDQRLEENTVYASVARPLFSADGRFAIVSMSIPWSEHSADVHFILERKVSAWKIISTSQKFYP